MLQHVLDTVLRGVLKLPIAAPGPYKPSNWHNDPNLPTFGQLADASQKYPQLPLDNLDGSFTGQPVGTTIFQDGSHWAPPLLPTQKLAPGPAHFDPTGSKSRYDDNLYSILPINPAAKPQPLSYHLQEMMK